MQTAVDIKNYIFDYCTVNDNLSEGELSDILHEIMDEEFDTILEDNSVNEISMSLIRQLHRCLKGNHDEVRADFVHLPPVARWLDPGAPKITTQDSDSDSDDDDGDDDEDMEQGDGEANVATARQQNGHRPNNSGVTQMDEDGWMTVTSRRRQR